MAYTHTLPANDYKGEIEKISIDWHENARGRLSGQAALKGGDVATLKAATEHFAYLSAVRLERHSVKILGSVHDTSTDIATNSSMPDPDHISLVMKSGGWKVHVYFDNIGHGPTAFDNLTVKGESVVKRNSQGKGVRDTAKSWGTLPPL